MNDNLVCGACGEEKPSRDCLRNYTISYPGFCDWLEPICWECRDNLIYELEKKQENGI
jgi:hypothetical protein